MCAPLSLQISGCEVHFTGALLLDARDAPLLDDNLHFTPGGGAGAGGAGRGAGAPEAGNDGEAGAAFSDDDGDGGGGFGGGGWGSDAGDEAPAGAAGGGDAPAGAAGDEAEAAAEDDEPAVDLWANMAFGDTSTLPSRPFRRGRTTLAKAGGDGARRGADAGADACAAAAKRFGAVFPEFGYAYEALAAVRRARAAAAAREAAKAGGRARRRGGGDGGGGGDVGLAPAPADNWGAAFGDGGGGGGDDDGGGGGEDDGWGGADGGCGDSDCGDDLLPPLEEDALAAAAAAGCAPPALAQPRARASPAAPPEQPPSYEECVRAHVEAYVAAAAAAEQHSDVALAVSRWKARIEPALAAAEARPVFDMASVGAAVVARCAAELASVSTDASLSHPSSDENNNGGRSVPFGSLVRGCEVFEVARAFAATLQLVNAGNLGVARSQAAGFAVTVLSTATAHEALDAYRAPSVVGPAPEPAKGGKAQQAAGKRQAVASRNV